MFIWKNVSWLSCFLTWGWTRNPYLRGMFTTVDLPDPTSSRPAAFKIENVMFLLYETRYYIKEVNCSDPSPYVRVSWLMLWWVGKIVDSCLVLCRSCCALAILLAKWLGCQFCSGSWWMILWENIYCWCLDCLKGVGCHFLCGMSKGGDTFIFRRHDIQHNDTQHNDTWQDRTF